MVGSMVITEAGATQSMPIQGHEYIDLGPKVVTVADYTQIKVRQHLERPKGPFCMN